MNNEASKTYLSQLLSNASTDCKERLNDVTQRFGEDMADDEPYKKHYQKVIGWMFELHKVNATTFYSLFNKVMFDTNLNTLEGLECMRSFVGNFFDDSGVVLDVDENREYPTPNGTKQMPIDPMFDWHIVWASEDKVWLSIQELINIMKKVYQADYDWCKECNKRFGEDKTSGLDKYDKSLLENP